VTAVGVSVDPTGFQFGSPAIAPMQADDKMVRQDSSGAPHQIGWDTAASPVTGVTLGVGALPPVVMPNAGTFNYNGPSRAKFMNGSVTVVS
jgi:hypothetical protein